MISPRKMWLRFWHAGFHPHDQTERLPDGRMHCRGCGRRGYSLDEAYRYERSAREQENPGAGAP